MTRAGPVRVLIDRSMRANAIVRVALGCALGSCAPAASAPASATGGEKAPLPSTSAIDAGADRALAPIETREEPKKATEAPHFPPPKVPPPSERSAKPGDGEWVALGDAAKAEQAALEPRVLYKTVIHPHPVSPWKSVTVVAIDLERASLELMEGTAEPDSKNVPKAERRGLVPAEEQARLLAAFNGGWQAKHGAWGMMLAGKVFVPPRPEGCTLAIYRDGSVRIGSWPALTGVQVARRNSLSVTDSEREMRAYRQTPPCLIENGEIHPELVRNRDAAWGGHDPGITTRHRSAIAIDAERRVLFYALGEETTPRELAQGLVAAGATDAAELDINFGWTKFLLFGRPAPDSPLQVTSTLFPGMLHRKYGYVSLSQPRDFFYVLRKGAN